MTGFGRFSTYALGEPCISVPKRAVKASRVVLHPKPARYPQTAFLSLLQDGQDYHGVYVEFEPGNDFPHKRDLRYQRYDGSLSPIGDSRLLLEGGEDPRIFRWRDRVWATSNQDQRLVNVVSGEVVQLTHDLQYAGKNWVPLGPGEVAVGIAVNGDGAVDFAMDLLADPRARRAVWAEEKLEVVGGFLHFAAPT